ncbi:hypothetical protein DPMN_144308 [Dreissena polymorpha]|uniref:Uncharacterized protein n=2 Tax=Dreissena polymorpha TaxID=45954 RepID=A0A9D4GKT9_DREPO|nr:hypothetical protein DPMN_144308 [Dreissena polymorpha]
MAINALQSKDMYDYFDMIRDFEVKKRKFEFDSQSDITFRIPIILKEISEEQCHQSLSERLASLKYGRKVFTRGRDKLGVNSSIIQNWFTEPVSKTVNHISRVLKEQRMKDVGLIVLVGGFADSPYVQQRFRQELPEKQLIVPGEAGLAVLKGAVMFGHKPDIISSRVMDHTYGVKINEIYDEEKHPIDKKVYRQGEWRVENCFEIFVRANDDVPVDSKVTRNFTLSDNPDYVVIHRTQNEDPIFTTESGCDILGTLAVDAEIGIPLLEQEIQVTFMFGDTDLHVLCTHFNTGIVKTLTLNICN